MIEIEPLQDRFGVGIRHPDFPGNEIRFRIPECWFCGLLPQQPGRDQNRSGWQPVRRYPFEVLGPGDSDWEPWQRTNTGWIGRAEVEGWWQNRVTVAPAADHVCIEVEVTNLSDWDYTELWAHFCANTDSAPRFRDLTGQKTYVFLQQGAVPVIDTHKYEGAGWRQVCNTYVPFSREMRVKEYLYGTPISQDRPVSPLIVRQSADGQALIAVCFRHWYGLFYDCHEKNNCIHSEPYVGDLESKQSSCFSGHLYWFAGSLDDIAAKARDLDGVWVPTLADP